jgi:SAM-dependent methyltransferase
MTPQDITIQTYKDNFDLYKEKTPSVVSGEFVALIDAFIDLLPKNGNVFELGSYEGRDARYLRDRGFKMFCTDVIPVALESLAADGFKTSMYDLRDEPQQEWINSYDGVFAKAVYLHVPQDIFEKSLDQMSTLLKDGGIFCLTFKLGVGEEIETGKLGGERYFKFYTEEELQNIFKKHQQYEFIESAVTDDGKWIQFLLRKK